MVGFDALLIEKPIWLTCCPFLKQHLTVIVSGAVIKPLVLTSFAFNGIPLDYWNPKSA